MRWEMGEMCRGYLALGMDHDKSPVHMHSGDLTNMSEAHSLPPANHFGCQPGRTATDSLHYVTKFTKDTWRRGEVVGALFLDIKSVFPSMLLGQCIHDIRQRGVYQPNTQSGF